MLQSRLHSDLGLGSKQKEWRSVTWTWKKEYQAGFAIIFLFDLGQVAEISLYFHLWGYLTGLTASGGRRLSQGYKLPSYSQVEDSIEMQISVSSYKKYQVLNHAVKMKSLLDTGILLVLSVLFYCTESFELGVLILRCIPVRTYTLLKYLM